VFPLHKKKLELDIGNDRDKWTVSNLDFHKHYI
jgi:hypothetical protein